MWMKIDDRLHAHRKTRAVIKSHPEKLRDAAPFGIWVLAGSWSAQNGTNGWVPEEELDRWDADWQALAQRLVRGGYWWKQERDREPGYGFTDWRDYNPSSEAASQSGEYGNHIRWHEQRGIVEPSCDHCPKEPGSGDSAPETEPESGGDVGTRSGGDIGGNRSTQPDPTPSRPEPEPGGAIADATPPPSKSLALVTDNRPDVERICEALADHIEARGSKRPAITTRWRKEARLLIDNDKRSEEQVHAAMRWLFTSSHRDALFWRTNIRSMPKLRAEYDRLRELAERPASGAANRNGQFQEQQQRALARAVEREREMGIRP